MIISDIKSFLVHKEATIREVMKKIDSLGGKGVFVTQNGILCGVVTDGDIRRSLLKGISIESPAKNIMNKYPTKFIQGTSPEEIRKEAIKKVIKNIPIVDIDNKVVQVFVHELSEDHTLKTPVILMAGGKGTRLGELTKSCPKPMLEVGGKPVLERTIENFKKYGFNNFYISVNYMADVIENYLGTGERHGVSIRYLREKKMLGTAGPLGMLSPNINESVIVMNGDLLTQVDFSRLMDFHKKSGAAITMCVRQYEFQVPYGVVNVEDDFVTSFDEKPTYKFNVSAGIYVIDSRLFVNIPKNEYFDMPVFLNSLLKEGIPLKCYPILERWIDIGREVDLKYARDVYRRGPTVEM